MCPNSLRGGTPPGLFTAGVSLRTPRINPEGEEEGGRRWVVEGVAPGRVPRHRWGQPSGSPVQSPLGLPFCSSATIGWPTGSVSGRSPPHPPLSFDPRGSREAWALGGPKKGLSGTPCGAKPRGGGGAPPTNLILLRNQRSAPRPGRRSTRPAPRPPSGQLAARLSRPADLLLLASPRHGFAAALAGRLGWFGLAGARPPPTTPLAGPGSPSTRPPLGPLSSPGEGRFAPCPAAAQRPASGPARAEPKGSQGRRPRGIPNFPARGLFLVRGSWIWSLQIGSRHSLPPTGTSGPPPRARAPKSPSLSGHRLPGYGG